MVLWYKLDDVLLRLKFDAVSPICSKLLNSSQLLNTNSIFVFAFPTYSTDFFAVMILIIKRPALDLAVTSMLVKDYLLNNVSLHFFLRVQLVKFCIKFAI